MTGENNTIRAIVRVLDGDEAMVEVEQGGCGRCHEEGGCGGQKLTQMFCSSPKKYRVANKLGAAIGEQVTVAIASGSVRRIANLAYGVPLAALIFGAVLGASIGGDPGAIAGAIFSLGIAVLYVRFRSQDRAGNFAERPYIVSRP